MSNANKSAYPRRYTELSPGSLAESVYYDPGLTKREYFAGLAMQGLLANPIAMELGLSKLSPEDFNNEMVATAVLYADNLLARLEAK